LFYNPLKFSAVITIKKKKEKMKNKKIPKSGKAEVEKCEKEQVNEQVQALFGTWKRQWNLANTCACPNIRLSTPNITGFLL
jgi:hypothetical protein